MKVSMIPAHKTAIELADVATYEGEGPIYFGPEGAQHFVDAGFPSRRQRPHIGSPDQHGTCPKCECLDHILAPSQCAEQGSSGQQVVLSNDLVDAWHPMIAKAVLKNWRMSEEVCEAVGAQAEVDVVRTGTASLTDVLVTGIRLAKRMRNHYDATSLSAGGVLARLNLSVEECQSLVNDAAADVRALERVLRS